MIRPIPLSLVLLPLALAACSKPAHGSGQGQPAAEHHGSPPIHVSQTVVDLRHGQPAMEHEYREHLATCSKLNVPVQPLDPAVVGKLGRTHYDTWYEGDRMAVRGERWSFGVDGLCKFKLLHERSLSIADADGTQMIDLDHGTGRIDPDLRVHRASPQAPKTGADDALKAAVAAQLQQRGQGDVMAQDGGQVTVAGQPCHRIHNVTVEVCVWSGGGLWGFDATGGSNPFDTVQSRLDSIVLSAGPADGGDGQYLTTQTMTVGERFDAGVFSRPAGIAMDKPE